MTTRLSRREFLKLSALSFGGLVFYRSPLLPAQANSSERKVRICTHSVSVYSQPNDKSQIVFQRFRDEMVNIYYEVISPDGPEYNPLWYRVWGGYLHSAHTHIEETRYNPVASQIPKGGQIAEVTVPYSQVMRWTGPSGWQPVYRLYYESTHWVVDIEEGPDGGPWYKVMDELLDIPYHVPAETLRLIPPEELAPISPDVPLGRKRIEVSIANQTLTAYENENVVLNTKISTGIPAARIPGKPPTYTPQGTFHIQDKMPSKHMGDGNLTNDIEAYELPGVPWVCFFEPETGVATHGTYWHNNFGRMMSHGCVNMRTAEAKWIFRWAMPPTIIGNIENKGWGTMVIVD